MTLPAAVMTLGIGIAARNEERTLPLLLEALRQQAPEVGTDVAIFVAANGCSDRTAAEARRFGQASWGEPRVVEDEATGRWWCFGGDRLRLAVHESPVARKSRALNRIQAFAGVECLLLFDADVRPGPGVVAAMAEALARPPGPGAVAVRYVGEIPPRDRRLNPLSEWCRIVVCRSFNHFDRHLPRLDGKAFGYRTSLVTRHPALIASDTWLEGVAWRRSVGCRYLAEVHVRYLFPRTLAELVAQYARYQASLEVLAREHPEALPMVRAGRSRVGRAPRLAPRLAGRLFLEWVRRVAGRGDGPGEHWEPIESTKAAW